MTERPHCVGTRRNGEPCRAKLGLSADLLCIVHDPQRAEEARQAHEKGGRAAGAVRRAKREAREAADAKDLPNNIPSKPRDFEDASNYLAWLVDAGAHKRIAPEYIRELTGALKAFQAAAEKRDLLRQIRLYRKALEPVRNCSTCGPKVAPILTAQRQ